MLEISVLKLAIFLCKKQKTLRTWLWKKTGFYIKKPKTWPTATLNLSKISDKKNQNSTNKNVLSNQRFDWDPQNIAKNTVKSDKMFSKKSKILQKSMLNLTDLFTKMAKIV